MAKRPSPDETPTAARRSWPAPDQRDFKGLMCRVNREGWRALSMLSVELDRSLQQMMVEALNDYLSKHGKVPVIESRAVPKD